MSKILDALDTLGRAQGAKALIDAHHQARRAVRSARSAAHAKFGTLAQAYAAAMENWAAQKAEGVPFAERVAGLEKTLRAAWPKGRLEAWHVLCGSCDDYGLVISACPGDATCGRVKPHLPHDFGKPCWCKAGARFKEKPKPTPDDFTAAGKPKGPQKVGRW